MERSDEQKRGRADDTFVVAALSAAPVHMLRVAAANGDQLAAAELLRRQGAEAA